MPSLARVLIVGAGPGGLSAAIALRQAGIEQVDIVEAADDAAVIGSELSLSGPNLRALDSLGVADACAEIGVALTHATFRTAGGEEIAAAPFPPAHRPGLPPTVGITRPNLHKVLREAAISGGASLRFHATATGVEELEEGVAVSLSDGTRSVYDFVIGADGVGSDVRRIVFGDAVTPQYVGQMAWRARVPRRTGPLLDVYYGPTSKAGLITVSEENSYLFLLETAPEVRRLPQADFPDTLRRALGVFGGDVADIREDIQDPAHIHYSPLSPIIMPAPWHRGRVLLIGDAVHATTPHLAYGAGLAIEDGVVLGDLARPDSSPEELSVAFAERRFERCRMTVENGIQLSRWEQNPDDPDADFVGLTGRSLGALSAPI
jgi:2-polyprenyl-6-methoxyphenol hydroxylase-like FAD-dependent oxidoreductase